MHFKEFKGLDGRISEVVERSKFTKFGEIKLFKQVYADNGEKRGSCAGDRRGLELLLKKHGLDSSQKLYGNVYDDPAAAEAFEKLLEVL